MNDVIPLRPTAGEPGAFGLLWVSRLDPVTSRWLVEGYDTGQLLCRLAVITTAASVPAEQVAWLTAQLLNDMPDGAAALALADHFDPDGD